MKRVDFSDFTEIAGYPGYYFNKKYYPFVLLSIGHTCQYMKPLTIYREDLPKLAYINIKDSSGKYKQVLLKNLMEQEQPVKDSKKQRPSTKVISFNQMQQRTPLTRAKVINYLLQERPNVQVPLTPNADSEYETGFGMKELGMAVCPECGNIQPLEFKICKHCNHFITI